MLNQEQQINIQALLKPEVAARLNQLERLVILPKIPAEMSTDFYEGFILAALLIQPLLDMDRVRETAVALLCAAVAERYQEAFPSSLEDRS